MIVVTCTCGARLKAKDEAVGRRIKCPRCNARIPVPALAVVPAAESESSPLDLLENLAAAAPPLPAQSTAAARQSSDDELYDLADGPAVPVIQPEPVVPMSAATIGYARDMDTARMAAKTVKGGAFQGVHGPSRGFWLDVIHAFAYPVASGGNIATLIILLVVAFASVLCGFGGGFGLLGQVAIYGWLAACYMNVISDTAAGSDDLPGLTMEEGWWGDIVVPAFKMLATFGLAMLPAIAYIVLEIAGVVDSVGAFLACAVFGIFMWPMIMLMFALGVWWMVFKPHLTLVTVAQTILPYLAVWLALLLSFGIRVIFMFGSVLLQFGIDLRDLTPSFFTSFAGIIVRELAGVYFTVVTMRIIGLYYLHFKKRFAFKLE